MKKIIRLTESDLTRIVKRVIVEQSKPNTIINKTANLYKDKANKSFDHQIRISKVIGAGGGNEISLISNKNQEYIFNCENPNELTQIHGVGIGIKQKLYGDSLTSFLKGKYCVKNKSGVIVPNADFANVGGGNQNADFA